MNASFKYSYFLFAWKQANIIPILKPGRDPSDPKSYNSISLLNALSKILERLLLHRLKSHVAEHRIYFNEQIGFREKHSTSHLILRVASGLAAKLSTGIMLLLDVEKAFDCVWHDALLHKLLGYLFLTLSIKRVMNALKRVKQSLVCG
jgi:hypothetical protein